MSLNANRPVNGSPEASSFCVTRYPSSGEDDSPSSCATNRLLIWMPSSAADPHTESQRTAVSELNSFRKSSIHRDQTFHRALLQKERIFFDELISMTVADHKVEIALLEQMIFNSGHDQRCVPFTDFRHNHADGVTPLLSKRPGEVIRPVIQLSGSRTDQFLRAQGNRFSSWNAVHHERDGRLRKSQMFCERLQTNAFPGGFSHLKGQGRFRSRHKMSC